MTVSVRGEVGLLPSMVAAKPATAGGSIVVSLARQPINAPTDSVSMSKEAQAAYDAMLPNLRKDADILNSKDTSDSSKLAAYADATLSNIQNFYATSGFSNTTQVSDFVYVTQGSDFMKTSADVDSAMNDVENSWKVSQVAALKDGDSPIPVYSSEHALNKGLSDLETEILSIDIRNQVVEATLATNSGSKAVQPASGGDRHSDKDLAAGTSATRLFYDVSIGRSITGGPSKPSNGSEIALAVLGEASNDSFSRITNKKVLQT